MEQCFLTVDVGTTSIKVSAVSRAFQIITSRSLEYTLYTDGAKVTLPAEIYWEKTKEGIKKVLTQIGSRCVMGITITTQGETMLPVDDKGNALYDAVVWLDGRAGVQAAEIKKHIDRETFYRTTGVPECNELCPVSKLLWFQQEEREIYEKAAYFLLLEDYLICRLTGRFVTEKSLLSTTGYFNLERDTVWNELLEELGLDAGKIPPALECGQAAGHVRRQVAEELGLPEETVVVTGAMDQVCSAVGAGNDNPGILTETTGTALCIGKTIQKSAIDPGFPIPVYRHYRKELQLLLPVCMTAGMALKWFRDTFCEKEKEEAAKTGEDVYVILDRLAQSAAPLSGGVVMLPYLAGSLQPYQNPDYRGGFLGVSLDSKKEDFVRAVMEGVSYMLKENLLLLGQRGESSDTLISMGGGARSDVWCQIKADVTGLRVRTLKESETTSIGAAMLCAMGVEGKQILSEDRDKHETAKAYSPREKESTLYREGFETYCRYLQGTIGGV